MTALPVLPVADSLRQGQDGRMAGVVERDGLWRVQTPQAFRRGVIEAAGGIITDWDGRPLGFESDGRVVSAATPELHHELLQLLSTGAGR